ncbi:MAG: ATP-binding cassette domain-containing protein [Eubacteriales bacterium]
MKIIIEELSYKNKTVMEKTRLDVEYGDFINVIGQNGSGKSSFFKALLGRINYKGKVDILPSEIAVVSDYSRLPKELKVLDVIRFIRNSKLENIEELIYLLNLGNIASNKIGKLSSGEKRRVEIFVALSSEKKIIIYDEITNALDMSVKNELLEFIKQHHSNNNKIAFFTTHDLSEMFYLGGKYWFLNKNSKQIEDLSKESQESIMKKYILGGE